MDALEQLAAKLDRLSVNPQATMRFDLFAGGLVWSDEWPPLDMPSENGCVALPVGLGEFRALLNHRSALILGDPRGKFKELWTRTMKLAPNWPVFLPERRDPAHAAELKTRSEASLRSWEEADTRFEQSRAATARASNA